jgi:hypothetical protein
MKNIDKSNKCCTVYAMIPTYTEVGPSGWQNSGQRILFLIGGATVTNADFPPAPYCS